MIIDQRDNWNILCDRGDELRIGPGDCPSEHCRGKRTVTPRIYNGDSHPYCSACDHLFIGRRTIFWNTKSLAS